MASKKLQIGLFGAGHMGNFHARAVAARDDVTLAGVYDVDAARAAQVAAAHGSQPVADADQLAGSIDAAVVAAKTVAHRDLVLRLIERGVAVLVEKPIAATGREAREIVAAAERAGVVVQVGHTLRFDPVTQAVAGRRLRPRYAEVLWAAPFNPRGTDVGVVMDLMIHGLDLVLHWAGEAPERVDAAGGCVIGRDEDFANARLAFPGGGVAPLTATRLSRTRQRLIRLFTEGTYLRLDYGARKVEVVSPQADLAERLRRVDAKAPPPMEELVAVENVSVDTTRDALRDQLASFVAAVRGEGPVAVPARDGALAVEVAEKVLAAIHGR